VPARTTVLSFSVNAMPNRGDTLTARALPVSVFAPFLPE
jgi:hypothetical protein